MTLLKQTSAAASETSTIDQASDHSAQNKIQRSDFDLDIVEEAPTQDQIRSILDYVGASNIGKVIKGASNEAEALKKFKADSENFQRPVVSIQKLFGIHQLTFVIRPLTGTMVKQVCVVRAPCVLLLTISLQSLVKMSRKSSSS